MASPWSSLNATSTCRHELSPAVILSYQQAAAAFMALVTAALLKPFGIPPMVSQLLAGILHGPTFLGRIPLYAEYVFPPLTITMLRLYTRIGMILQLLIIGIQIDPRIIVKPERKLIVISVTMIFFPLVLAIISSNFISKTFDLDPEKSESLEIIGVAQSLNTFPVIACYLHELKIIHSEFSRVAFSCAMISGILSYIFQTIGGASSPQVSNKKLYLFSCLLWNAFVLLVLVYLIRPLIIRWIIEEIPQGKKVSRRQLSVVIMIAMLVYLFCARTKIHPFFGVFLFGVVIPTEPPLGSALVERLQFFTTWMIMPLFYISHGLTIDVFAVKLNTAIYVESMVLIAWIGKFMGAFFPALYYNMSFKEAVLLGITATTQGFIEIAYLRILEERKVINHEFYTIICLSILVQTGSLAPVMRSLYNSSLRSKLNYIRNLQCLEPDGDLRVLACLFEEDNIPSIIHLFKAIIHPKDSPVTATIIHFINLVGRSAPAITSHTLGNKETASNPASRRILNVFKRFEENNDRVISVHPYTVRSPYASTHNDAFIISIKQRNSLIILPFHEKTSIEMKTNAKMVNCNILENAPCSVGIVIDRGRLGGLRYVFTNWRSFHVVLLFFGGADDREALSLGERMLGNPTVELTVIRFCKVGDNVERISDDAMINEFMYRVGENERMTYIRKEVSKGLDVIRVIELMGNQFELIILGRRHDEHSPILDEFTSWNTYPELGTLGDIFVTSNYGGKATIFVIQQQLDAAE